MTCNFKVTVKVVIEHFATVTVRARNQAEADERAIDAYYRDAHTDHGQGAGDLGLPRPRWYEQTVPLEHDAVIDQRFRCIDCGKDTCDDEYYRVPDDLWAAAGMAPNGGMLCLADLERRIGRWLTLSDFTAMVPSLKGWQRHLAARKTSSTVDQAVQLELLERGAVADH